MYNSHTQRGHLTSTTNRFLESLENIKTEYENLSHDANMYKLQKEDYERKLQAQLNELGTIQQTLFELERNQAKMKQQYEEEIMRLRRQLELQNPNAPSLPPVSTASVTPKTPNFVRQQNLPIPLASASSLASNIALPDTKQPLQTQALNMIQQKVAPLMPSPNTISSLTNPGSASKRTRDIPIEAPAMPVVPVPASSKVQKIIPNTEKDISDSNTTSNGVTESNNNAKIDASKEGVLNAPGASATNETSSATVASSGSSSTSSTSSLDWTVVQNPNVASPLNIQLQNSFDHSSVVCCVKFSPDGKYLATGCNKAAYVYDLETGSRSSFPEETPSTAKEQDLYIRSVCFSPDNKLLATGAEDKVIKLWSLEDKKLMNTFVGHETEIYSLDFSPTSQLIVSGSGDRRVKIWDIDKKEALHTLGNEETGPKDGVTSVAFSPDGRFVAAGSLDCVVRLWDVERGYFLERYDGHMNSVYSVAFSPDGKTLVSGSLDKTLKLWDLSMTTRQRARCRSTFNGHKDFVLSVAFSQDGNWIISGSKDRTVQFWDPRSSVPHCMLQGHKNSVISVGVGPKKSNLFATGSGDWRARVWKYSGAE